MFFLSRDCHEPLGVPGEEQINLVLFVEIHLLHVGWRNFFPVVVLCQFLVLAGNRFWFYILMYLEYNTVVVSY